MTRKVTPLADRLWRRCIRSENGCLEWQGWRDREGRGRLNVGRRGEGSILVHRAAWLVTYGDIPEGFDVCHKCDNPPCCDPEHLFLGTHRDNMADMRAKGRAHSRYKLTDEQVHEIKERYAKRGRGMHGGNAMALAREFGISVSHAWTIANNRE